MFLFKKNLITAIVVLVLVSGISIQSVSAFTCGACGEGEVTTYCGGFYSWYYDTHDYYYNSRWWICQREIDIYITAYQCDNPYCPVGSWQGTHVESIFHGAYYCWDYPGGVYCPWK
ncbi:MAG: hypothetical protein PHG48_03655 [Eubacteriales bacterium]|nr:hypothetical protein [Eubacteriales bacterium]